MENIKKELTDFNIWVRDKIPLMSSLTSAQIVERYLMGRAPTLIRGLNDKMKCPRCSNTPDRIFPNTQKSTCFSCMVIWEYE